MSHVTDVVCEIVIDTESAPEKSSFRGRTFYFCSTDCLRLFQSDPGAYVGFHLALALDTSLERHGSSYTESGGIVAPKSGAARPGRAEYERLAAAQDQQTGSEESRDG